MCGICGAFHRTGPPPDPAEVERVNDRIAHRGPDDAGIHLEEGAALAMRRLSILDIEGGAQPMRDAETGCVLVYNGEIYNHRELREQLRREGCRFDTHCDTEVVLALLARNGREGLAALNGMFALALWDPRDQSVLLARDGLGIKPLYYQLEADRLLWASELRAMEAWKGVSREPDPRALARYLVHEYVPSPLAMLEGVRKLEPGCWLRFARDGSVEEGRFWAPPFSAPEGPEDPVVVSGRFLELLAEVVERQMVADVPVGIFLSGGLDSSALAAAAARILGAEIETFSVGFREGSFDESSHARRVAAHLETNHHEEILEPSAALDLVPDLVRFMDEPLGDASVLPTSLLCRFARRHVKVALSGDGGDELFGGYPTYPAHRVASLYRLLGPLGPGLVAPLARLLPVSYRNFSLDFKAKRFVRGAHRTNPARHLLWMGSFHPDRVGTFLQPELAREAGDPWEPSRELWRAVGEGPEVERVRRFDLLSYLRDDLLAKTDRASMAHSLEVRVPLLDQALVAWAEKQRPEHKIRGWQTKVLVRRALEPHLPREILERPKKGFGVPMGRWLRGPLRPMMQELLDPDRLDREGIFVGQRVQRLVEAHLAGRADERKRIWTLMAYQLWSLRD